MLKRARYTADFKLSAIEKAKLMGNRAAARELNIHEKCIRRWRLAEEKIVQQPKYKCENRYRSPLWTDLEKELATWVVEKRDGGHPISTVAIRFKAKEIATTMNLPDFTGNPTWCYRFMERYHLPVRSQTTKGQKLPHDWEEKMESFKTYVNTLVTDKKFEPCDIINMDEVPMTFDCPPFKPFGFVRGEQTVTFKFNDCERTYFTVVLTCAANGFKLKPLVIFKCKTMPKETFPNGIVVCVNEKGWMNEDVMCTWANEVLRKTSPNEFFEPSNLLIMDSMRAHVTKNVMDMCNKAGSYIAIIPCGLRKKLQPSDISVNKSFKAGIRTQWEKWMSGEMDGYTNNRYMKPPSCSTVCSWVLNAWANVPESCIVSGFRVAGLLYETTPLQDVPENKENGDEEMPDANLSEEMAQLFHSDSEDSVFEGF